MKRKVVLFLLFSFAISFVFVGQVDAYKLTLGTPPSSITEPPIPTPHPPPQPPPQDPTEKCIPIPGKVVCIENPLNTGSLTEIIDKVINFIFRIALVVVPLMILYGGFLFVTGGGNPDQISRGKRVLMWTVIGLIVIILSKGLVTLLQTALGVSGS